MRGHKGEVLTIVAVTVAATLILSAALPSINLFGKIFGGGSTAVKAPAEEAWKEQEQRTIPRTVGVTETGEKVIAFEQVKTFRSGASKMPAKLTYGERIGEFFAGLTTWGIIILLVLFFAFGITPAAVVTWIKNRKLKATEADLEKRTQALRNTVAALREVPDDVWPKIKQLLEAKHDRQDKVIIDEIKKDLH